MVNAVQTSTWAGWVGQLTDTIQRSVWDSINAQISGLFGMLPGVLAGAIVLLIFWITAKILRSGFLATTRRTNLDIRLRLLTSRLIVVVVYVVGVLTALSVIIPSFNLGSVIAGLGFTSFVIGFAAKDIVNNFLSGVLILWQQPFHIGDYLFVGPNQGKVEFIGVRATSLRKDDGEIILIPNGDMYSSALTIRAAGTKRRMALKFSLGYGTDVQAAKETILEAMRGVHGVMEKPSPNVIVADLAADGVHMTTNFWINTNEAKPLEVFDRTAVSVMTALRGSGIQLFTTAPPTITQTEDTKKENPLPAEKRG